MRSTQRRFESVSPGYARLFPGAYTTAASQQELSAVTLLSNTEGTALAQATRPWTGCR
jgi:hypothetical protein